MSLSRYFDHLNSDFSWPRFVENGLGCRNLEVKRMWTPLSSLLSSITMDVGLGAPMRSWIETPCSAGLRASSLRCASPAPCDGLNCVPQIYMFEVQTSTISKYDCFCSWGLTRGHEWEWALILSDKCPHIGHAETHQGCAQRDRHVKQQQEEQEDGHLQAKGEATCPHLDLRLLSSRTMRRYVSVV